MWEPRRLTTLWAFMACYRDSFTFIISIRIILRNEREHHGNDESHDFAKPSPSWLLAITEPEARARWISGVRTEGREILPTYFVCSQPHVAHLVSQIKLYAHTVRGDGQKRHAWTRRRRSRLPSCIPFQPLCLLAVLPTRPVAGEGSVTARERFRREVDGSIGPRSMASGQFSEHYSYLCSL
jgi:hypothetical protein